MKNIIIASLALIAFFILIYYILRFISKRHKTLIKNIIQERMQPPIYWLEISMHDKANRTTKTIKICPNCFARHETDGSTCEKCGWSAQSSSSGQHQ
ncbi:hypothetical protein [Solidesulfovibrio fructosivorans]|uniref:hypothetical protein n=1 Tax=Solidesulfovibrio fructosivorans TaxID=878 RepID=UPI00117C770B|nr:hypothetical protein [Solidesulfovibrio fructosivorans]